MKPGKYLPLLLLSMIAGHILTAAHPSSQSTPMFFIENKGQVTDQYHFPRTDINFKLAATNGLNVFFGNGAIHYQFSKPGGPVKKITDTRPGEKIEMPPCLMYRMDVELVGANKDAKFVAGQEQPYYERHYTVSDDGEIAHSYGEVTYKDVYPGIDWVLYNKAGKLKYEFIVHRGANPAWIKLRYSGAASLGLQADGSLLAITPQGTIAENAPYTYQHQDGKEVASHFVLHDSTLSFEVGTYNGDIVIDPSLKWGTYYGGSMPDYGSGVATDSSEKVYLSGYANSASGIATTGAFQTVYAGSADGFLARFNSDGSRIWATYYGGIYEDIAYSIKTFGNNAIYIGGYSMSTTGIASTGSYQSANAGGNDAFLAKFDTAGARIWGTYYGGPGFYDVGQGVAVDSAGNPYLVGYTNSSSGIASPGAFQTFYGGGSSQGDAFIVKFNSAGLRRWATYYGGSNNEAAQNATVDKAGNVYMAGFTDGSGGLATTGAHQTMPNWGAPDGLLVKFDSVGTRVWATYYGGTDQDYCLDVVTDTSGNVYMAGTSSSTTSIATPGAYQTTMAGFRDIILVKFNSAGVRQWGTYYGGNSVEYGTHITINDSGKLYITGATSSTTGIATAGAYMTSLAGSEDVFIARFNNTGSIVWATYYGGGGSDNAMSITARGYAVYVAGLTESTYNIATPSAFQPTLAGGTYDAFLSKFLDCPVIALTSSLTPPDVCDSTVFSYTPATSFSSATYTWTRAYVPGIASLAAAGSGNPNETLDNTTFSPVAVTYVYTINVGACSDTAAVVVNVKPTPALSSPATTAPICDSALFYYTPVSAVAGTTFTWSRSAVPGISNPAATGVGYINEVLHNITSAPVSIPYTYVLDAAGCTDTQTVTVIVDPYTTSGAISGADTLCIGTTITLSSTVGGGTWSSGGGNASVSSGGMVTGVSSGSAVISYVAPGMCIKPAIYMVTVSNAPECYTAVHNANMDFAGVKVYPNPGNGTFTVFVSGNSKQLVPVMLTNVFGQKVAQYLVQPGEETKVVLQHVPGIYFLSVSTVGARYTQKVEIR